MAAEWDMRKEENDPALIVPLWLVWLAAFIFVVAGLGSFGILDNNEGLYSEIPREMLASGDWRQWIIPHLNGLPYMEKPPLLYWLTALCFAVFGESEWSARAVPALSSLACVAMLLHFGKLVQRPQTGRLAALMFVSGIGVMAMSRVLMFDMLLTALLTAAILFAYRYMREGAPRFMRLAYAFLALALLAKGFVALILFGLVVAGYIAFGSGSLRAAWRAILQWLKPSGLLIFLAIAAPWHIAASLTEPAFAWFYFINEHVLRFMGKREPHDYYSGPWWYYLPRMVIYLFPWSFLLLCLFKRRTGAAAPDTALLKRFLWVAWLAPLIFFSVSSAKANYYLVAVMPFAAFHLALALEERNFLQAQARALPGILIAACAAALCIVLLRREDAGGADLVMGLSQRDFLIAVMAGVIVLALAASFFARRFERIGIQAYVVVSVWIAAAMGIALSSMEALVSTRPLVAYLQSEHPEREVYLYRVFEQKSSLAFGMKKTIPVIGMRSNDLFWGDRLRPGNAINIPERDFGAMLRGRKVAVVVMDEHLPEFRAADFHAAFKSAKHIGKTTVFLN